VVSCTTTSGVSGSGSGSASGSGTGFPGAGSGTAWRPTSLVAAVPASLVGKVALYSGGDASVLGPTGWTCSQLLAADGSSSIAVYPPGTPDPTTTSPTAGASLVDVQFDYTGHVPGTDLVCPYFPPADPSQYAGCQTTPPSGEVGTKLTPDIVSITDPVGVKGTLAGSGGSQAVRGALIVPHVQTGSAASINVAQESCSLPSAQANLCPAILTDFEIRDFPAPPTTSPG
jgi:hypothetical protein